MVYPCLLAAVSDAAHPTWRARALSVYRFWRDLGYAIGALTAGVLAALRLTPNVLTISGVFLNAGVAFVLVTGNFFLAGWLYLAVSLTEKQHGSLGYLLAAGFFMVSVVFVYRSFYGMRIGAVEKHASFDSPGDSRGAGSVGV